MGSAKNRSVIVRTTSEDQHLGYTVYVMEMRYDMYKILHLRRVVWYQLCEEWPDLRTGVVAVVA